MSNSKPLFTRVNTNKPLDKEILKAVDKIAEKLGNPSAAVKELITGGLYLYKKGELSQKIGQMKDGK